MKRDKRLQMINGQKQVNNCNRIRTYNMRLKAIEVGIF